MHQLALINPTIFHSLASEKELSLFLKDAERRAFQRTFYHVRNTEAALDIVQDSMMKLAEHYGDKPVDSLGPLFQKILSNCIMDWFRKQKTHNTLFSNISDFESDDDQPHLDVIEKLFSHSNSKKNESPEDLKHRAQTLREIELEIKNLPARQREAFLMRYWEDMDLAETANAMGCTQGSVKTHCFRAINALARALSAKGINL